MNRYICLQTLHSTINPMILCSKVTPPTSLRRELKNLTWAQFFARKACSTSRKAVLLEMLLLDNKSSVFNLNGA